MLQEEPCSAAFGNQAPNYLGIQEPFCKGVAEKSFFLDLKDLALLCTPGSEIQGEPVTDYWFDVARNPPLS